MELSLGRISIAYGHLCPKLLQANLQGTPISMVHGKSREDIMPSGRILEARVAALIEINEVHTRSLPNAETRQSSQLKAHRLGTSLEQ